MSDLDPWTTDLAVHRDVSHEQTALERLEEELADEVAAVRALGFQPLGVLASTLLGGGDVPDLDPAGLEQLRREAEDGDETAAAQLAQIDAIVRTHRDFDRRFLAWVWHHPERGDVVYLERVDDRVYAPFQRLAPDGTIVRTYRRPPTQPDGFPMVTGGFASARVPGLHAAVVALAGDAFAVNKVAKPGIRQFDRALPTLPLAEAYAHHLAHVDEVLGDTPAAPVDMTLATAMSRRTMHALKAFLEADAQVHATAGLVRVLAAFGGAALLTGLIAQSWGAAVLGVALCPLAGQAIWRALCGWRPPTMPVALTLVVLVAARQLGWPWTPFLAAIGLGAATDAAHDLFVVWMAVRGKNRLATRLRTPPPVPADELVRRYPPRFDV